MMSTRRPAWWASQAVEFAALAVPAGGRRDRYRQEFLVELYDMDHAQQLRHALGVLAQAWTLRTALGHTPEDDAVTIHWFLRLCCKLNIHHVWELRYTDDNELFEECVRCGRTYYRGPGTGSWGMSGFPGPSGA
jgi:hypothetical protein